MSRLQGLDVTCSASGHGLLILGDATGHIHTFDETFEQYKQFSAFNDRVYLLQQLKMANVLVCRECVCVCVLGQREREEIFNVLSCCRLCLGWHRRRWPWLEHGHCEILEFG